MALKDTSIIWKVNICLQILALVVSLVGFGSDHLVWITFGNYEIYGGLWKICFNKNICLESPVFLQAHDLNADWMEASKAMMSISLILHFLGMLMTFCAAFFNTTKITTWISAVVEFIAAFFGIIGVAIGGGKIKEVVGDLAQMEIPVSWSFIVFLVAQFSIIGIGLLHILDSRLKMAPRPFSNSTAPKITTIT